MTDKLAVTQPTNTIDVRTLSTLLNQLYAELEKNVRPPPMPTRSAPPHGD